MDLKKYNTDLLLWAGIVAVCTIITVLMALFTTTPAWYYIQKMAVGILIMFLPGYIIVKLFLDKVQFTDNPMIDRFILSFLISIGTVQTLAFMSNYIITYGFNVDAERINTNYMPLIVVALVIFSAVGLKFLLQRKKDRTNPQD